MSEQFWKGDKAPKTPGSEAEAKKQLRQLAEYLDETATTMIKAIVKTELVMVAIAVVIFAALYFLGVRNRMVYEVAIIIVVALAWACISAFGGRIRIGRANRKWAREMIKQLDEDSYTGDAIAEWKRVVELLRSNRTSAPKNDEK